MAKRFGGKYSPVGGAEAEHAGRRADAPAAVAATPGPAGPGWRVRLLYLPPLILAFTSLGLGATGLALGLSGAVALALGAWLLGEGLRAEAAYDARKVARRPAIPRKIFAAALTGLGAGLAAYTGATALIGAALYAVIAASLMLASFGLDPLRDKRMAGIDDFQQDRVARVVEQAEAHLTAMLAPIENLGERALIARVAEFQRTTRRMIRTVEEDPRDLTAARKYLSVYLQGARDATLKFTELYARRKDASARDSYTALLDDLDAQFAARTEGLLADDRSAMDIEINVLRDRLQREGIALTKEES